MASQSTSLKQRNKKKQKRSAFLAAVISGTVLLGIYLCVGFFYSSHFFPKTIVGGIPCGNKTAGYVEKKNITNAKEYLLTITDRKDSRFSIKGSDFGYEYDAMGEEEALLKKQNGFTWPAALMKTHTYELARSFTYDEQALEKLLDALPLFDEEYIEPPADAHLDITEDDFKIVKESEGNQPVPDIMKTEIKAAIENQKTKLTLSDNCYEKPNVYADDPSVTEVADKIERFTASTVHYEIDGADETVDKKRILSFLDIGEDGDVSLNDDKITQYVQHLASTYNTYGDVRTFKTSKKDKVKIGGGDYGWVVSKSKEKEQLLADLKGGVPVDREPVYEQRAEKSGLDDIGDTYIEIDYTNQHLWYYKEGKLVTDTDIVSGNINRGNGSPDGVYKIVYKERNATLVGENYASDVKYFMPFAYNVGIHDASWRHGKFGEEIYKTNGSHGCINVPEDIAEKLFETVETGTPVIAYYREPVELTAENARISNAYSYVDPKKE